MAESTPHVTVVFAGQSEPWAHWMARQLTEVGTATALVRWNPARSSPTADALTGMLTAPGRVLLVIDDWFERFDDGLRTAWADALRQMLADHPERIAGVSVTTRPLPEAIIALGPVALRGLSADAARRRVLEVAGAPDGAVRPVTLDRVPRFPDDPPDIQNVPRRNRRFTGRGTLLDHIHDTFAAGRGEGAVLALCGPGGIGKTQIALEYVHRFKGEYDIVWWLDATTTGTAREQFGTLAEALGAGVGSKLDQSIAAAAGKLRATGDSWLIVLDGAGDPEKLAALLPEGAGDVLVTTNHQEWSALAELFQVGHFEREESVAFAGRRSQRLSPYEAGLLAEAVEDLPLLLDQTAAWLDINPTVDIPEYIRELTESNPDRFGVLASQDYPVSFQIAWARTLGSLREQDPGAWKLLNLLARFSPGMLPLRLLQSARATDLPKPLDRVVPEPSSWNSALRRLSEVTSMRLEYDPVPRMGGSVTVAALRMHRIFHSFVRHAQTPGERAELTEAALKVLVTADPRDPASSRNWSRYAELIPHLEIAGALESADEDVRRLVLNCIEYLRMRGEYEEGGRLSRAAVEHWERVSGATSTSVLVAVHQRANMERRLGRYAEAEAVGREVLERLLSSPGAEPIEVIRARDGLGGTLLALGRYDEARTLFEQADREAVTSLGDAEVPRTLSIRNNLAEAMGLQGKYQASLDLHRDILTARVALLGGRNPLTLHSALRTATMLRLLGRYREALEIQQHNSRLHGQELDRNHGQTLNADHNLALCLRRDGKLLQARALLLSVRKRRVARRGRRHPDTLRAGADFAMLLREAGEFREAYDLADETASLYALQLGELHPYAVGTRANLALLQGDAGDHDGALELAEQTLEQMTDAVGADHPWTLGCAFNTATARQRAGDAEGAVRLGHDLLDRSVRSLGPGHPLTTTAQTALARDLRAAGDTALAGRLHAEALARITELLGDDHQHTRSIRDGAVRYWDFEPQFV
ncbi:FxSxx-COOH system tetratricopeptide repeat protein [Streptomyces sp. NBC_01306]|uniref:FxSxx-COOH system tetratricopeptide repeat protein n=1 Tax=Streptomyces sp. NBC_01306 TaxID=2903819 RepID=UPI002256839D|nr:FxSxx-COOH system tetratricopeptide repeat protein [Streptomyces sp. NBC_01306]MCX4723801.1 FxSxx-COOH system tetratricopeptide repeat protein [Streptomyces sp. NBC_01306]